MMRTLLALSLVVVAKGIHINRAAPGGFQMVEEMVDEDPSAPSLAETDDDAKSTEDDLPKYDESGLLIQRHDPSVEYGYVGEWSAKNKIKAIEQGDGAMASELASASFLEESSSTFAAADLVDDLSAGDEATVGTMSALPFHQTYAAAMAKYEEKFRKHFPEPMQAPFRFQEDFTKASSKPRFEGKDGGDYVWIPVPADFTQEHIKALDTKKAKEEAPAHMRFSEVRAKAPTDANLSEDGYLPFDAVTPGTLSLGQQSPVPAWNNALARNGPGIVGGSPYIQPQQVGAGPGFTYAGAGLYAGSLQAPPPPPRPDNLPPPPWIKPVPLPAAAAGAEAPAE